MILTLTPDPVLDNILLIEEWTPGIPIHALANHLSVGGKGLDSSVTLTHLGIPTTAFCFLAGRTGKELSQLISNQYGFSIHAVWTEGETRTAHIISETKNKTHSHIFTGEIRLTEENEAELLTQFEQALPEANFVIVGGVLPPTASNDLYARFIQSAREANCFTLIDAHSQFMLDTLPIKPDVVKMNQDEFIKTFNLCIMDFTELIEAGRHIRSQRELNNLIITCGSQGILGLTNRGDFHAQPPILKPINAAGAGDAASAAIAWQLSQNTDWQTTLKWAAAVSAAVVLTEGTADCRQLDIEQIYPEVKVKEL